MRAVKYKNSMRSGCTLDFRKSRLLQQLNFAVFLCDQMQFILHKRCQDPGITLQTSCVANLSPPRVFFDEHNLFLWEGPCFLCHDDRLPS